jgi:hypothetical protein
METIRIGEVELPKEITLTYDKEGAREWFEYWKGKKGIVIQRYLGNYFYIFLIEGKAVRTYKDINTKAVKAYKTIEEAIKELENLGFKVKVRV